MTTPDHDDRQPRAADASQASAPTPHADASMAAEDAAVTAGHMARCGVGGVLMGLANLVPGISGGTMLLAAGVYPKFIQAIADLSALRFRKQAIVTLGCVVVAALLSIVGLAGVVKNLVVDHRWVMYSLFIGLTLGGVPVVWRLITQGGKKATGPVWLGAVVGFVGMAVLAIFQMNQTGSSHQSGWLMMLVAGVAGASAMILPGVSGGYLLLVLGVYVPILSAVDAFKNGLKAVDIQAMWGPGVEVVLPVGLGVLLGVAVVSNALKWALAKHEQATLGVLLGLLIGAVVGLWPFQAPQIPAEGDQIKGQSVTWVDVTNGVEDAQAVPDIAEGSGQQLVFAVSREPVDVEDWPTAFFRPTVLQGVESILLIGLGLGLTTAIARLGKNA